MTDALVRVVSICTIAGSLRMRDQMFYEQRFPTSVKRPSRFFCQGRPPD